MARVKFGLFLPTADMAAAIAAARRAEREGFYSVSINDHFFTPLGPPETPQLECFTTLAAIAALTETVRLAPLVTAVSFRTPPLLAKIASTLDHVSGGRLVLGLGAGWFDAEYAAHGYPFPPTRERLAQLGEAIRVLKAMWTEDEPCFAGRYFQIEKAYGRPQPVQKPHPPLMLGGSGTELLRIAAAEADIVNLIPPTGNGKDFVNDPVATQKFDLATLKQRVALLHRFAAEAGRDPQEIELGGVSIAGLSRDPGDPAPRAVAAQLGFADFEAAAHSPVALLGTPSAVVDELETRIAETGVSYYVVLPTSEETHELLAGEVLPAFA